MPETWRLAPQGVQDTLEDRLGRLPGADATGWEPKTAGQNDTTLVVSVINPGALGASGSFDPDDDEKNVRDIIAGAKDGLKNQQISGARFDVQAPTALDGTKAVVYDTAIPDPMRGQVFSRTLVSGRGSRVYSIQADGPVADAQRMRSAIEQVRRAWSWR